MRKPAATQSSSEPEESCQHGCCSKQICTMYEKYISQTSRPYKCNRCNKKYRNNCRSYRRHLYQHMTKREALCTSCFLQLCRSNQTGKDEFNRKDLNFILSGKPRPRHRANVGETETRTENTRQSTYMCSLCCATYFDMQTLKSHLFNHNGYLPILCKLCENNFEMRVAANVAGGAPEDLYYVPVIFKAKSELDQHVLECHGEVLSADDVMSDNDVDAKGLGGGRRKVVVTVCECCNSGFFSESELLLHLEENPLVNPSGFIGCGLYYVFHHALSKEQANELGLKDRKLECFTSDLLDILAPGIELEGEPEEMLAAVLVYFFRKVLDGDSQKLLEWECHKLLEVIPLQSLIPDMVLILRTILPL